MGEPATVPPSSDGAGPVGTGVATGVGVGSTVIGVAAGAPGPVPGAVGGGGAVDAQPAKTASERVQPSLFNGSVPLRGWPGARPGNRVRGARSGDTSPTASIGSAATPCP